MTRHYVLYEISKEEVIAFLQAYKRFGYLVSASLAQHFPKNAPPHIHVVFKFQRKSAQRDLFADFPQCALVDAMGCDEHTWRLYLSQNGKTPIIDI